jgi:hypothetical protein
VEVALHDRPALREVFGVLAACVLLLVVLAKMDNEAARKYAARAQHALAAQAAARRNAPPKPKVTSAVVKVEARTESLGGRGPIAIPIGAAWTAGTSAAVTRTRAPAVEKTPTPPTLRRIVGPETASAPVSERIPAKPTAVPQVDVARVPVSATAPVGDQRSAILAAMMAVGLAVAAVGAILLSRR